MGVVIVAVALAAAGLPRFSGVPNTSAATGEINFADVVMTDLTREEEFNGKLESIKGTGTVIPAAQIALAFDTAGTVVDLSVQVGQEVQAGDVLARLDTTDLERAVTQAEISLRQVEILLEAALQPPTGAQIQAAQDAVDQTAAALHLQQINQASALNSALVIQSLPDAQENYQARLTDYTDALARYNDGKIVYWYVDQAQQALKDAEDALTSVELAVGQTTQSADNNLAQAADQLSQAKAALEALVSGVDTSTIESLELQVQAAGLNLELAQETLSDTTLVAPFDGVATDIAVVVGQDVGSATSVVSLADLSQPTLEVFLGETNLDKVAVGTEVEVRFSALPAEQYSGTIVQIDPQLVASGNDLSLLRVLVRVDNDQGRTLPAGLTASVNVIGSSNRIVRVFLPLADEGVLAVGDPVTVELPDFSQVPGTIVFVPQEPTSSVSGSATFRVLVELAADPATDTMLADLPDETSVDVIFVSDAVTDVMAIPVSALVALLEGGYAVEVKTGLGQPQTTALVAVELGFFGSNSMIAVNSDVLQPGDRVVVP
jgi:HlyD family secretion protein